MAELSGCCWGRIGTLNLKPMRFRSWLVLGRRSAGRCLGGTQLPAGVFGMAPRAPESQHHEHQPGIGPLTGAWMPLAKTREEVYGLEVKGAGFTV